MHLLTFRASPTPSAKEFHDLAGAYVSCWIQDGSREEAEARAAELIAEYGWEVEALQSAAVVTGADYQDDDEDRQFYEQALVEGEVLVFNAWPYEEGEEEDEDEDEDEEDE